MKILSDIYVYRGFIFANVKREFQAKYRDSLLGAAWTILNPLAMIVVYTVIFSQVMRARLPGADDPMVYSIFLCTGILTWELFAEITRRGQNVFLENANLIKKISFPRICLPVILIFSSCLNFLIIFSLFVGFLLVSNNFPGWVFLGIFPVLLIQIQLAVGLAVILGVLNVFFRDVGQFFNLLLQFWFWFTPIVYPIDILPEVVRSFALTWNPMTPIITAYQGVFIKGQWPQWDALGPVTLVGFLLCILGFHFYRKRSGEMVDEL
jgi:lipopolysaccharide transport system permease protein